MLLITVGLYSVACMQAKYPHMMESKGLRLCSSNAGYIRNVKCMVSASYTIFMLDTINATMYLPLCMATGRVVDSQWLYLVVSHLC